MRFLWGGQWFSDENVKQLNAPAAAAIARLIQEFLDIASAKSAFMFPAAGGNHH